MKPKPKPKPQFKPNPRKLRQQAERDEIDSLISRTKEPIVDLELNQFSDLPISSKTLEGLKNGDFVEMTDIQKKALPIALCKKDILAAAKTGSGKTLAFLIPLLETLYLDKWGPQDGLGALVIAPTRELAVQIFRVLCKIGKLHSFSAGLVIGGKDLKQEKKQIQHMNILIGTPGRLLQHMDETSFFEAQNLQLLVLDEADRILDMGFSKALNSILDFLPKSRQTLLFSATQTKSIRDLSRLSLSNPEYVGVYDQQEFSTPANLTQHYMVVELPQKLDILYSFIKTHLKCKGIVFMSSCKQVRFVFETFCKLQPGVPLLHLHGKQKQTKRVEIFEKFTVASEAFMFCTDVAARGLDFPSIDWVIQLDCPEDVQTYIHRVGRTARYESKGNALLFLLPSEEKAMVQLLENIKIPISNIAARKSQIQSIQPLLQSFCFKDPEIKYLGQKAFVTYLKSVYLQKNKNVFNVHELPVELYAASLGLPGMPQIKFKKKGEKSKMKIEVPEQPEDHPKEEDKKETKVKPKTKVEKLFAKKNRTVLADHYGKLVDRTEFENPDDENDSEGEFMTIKRQDHEIDSGDDSESAKEIQILTKRQVQKIKQKIIKNTPKGEKLIFDEDGIPHSMYELEDGEDFIGKVDVKAVQQQYFDEEHQKLELEDVVDKSVAKDKKRAKKLKQKLRESQTQHGPNQVVLGVSDSEASESSCSSDNDSQECDDEDDDVTVDYTRNKRKSNNIASEKVNPKRSRILDADHPDTLEAQEALALKLLGGNL